jgi:ribosomal protein S18 acetylase RimI-like enzyme
VEPEQWRDLRDLRLRALADAPAGFESTLEQERARAEREWRDWAARLAGGVDAVAFVVDDGGVLRGLVVAFLQGEEPARATAASLWVAPEARRRGLGTALLERAVEWAEDAGADQVTLWSNETAAAALGLYERAGFAATGARRPLPSLPDETLIELALPLPR